MIRQQQMTGKATMPHLPGVTNEDHSVSKAIFCQSCLAQDKRHLPSVLDQHRVSNAYDGTSGMSSAAPQHRTSMPSLLLGKHRKDGRGTQTTQNILKHWESQALFAAWATHRAKIKQQGNTGEGTLYYYSPMNGHHLAWFPQGPVSTSYLIPPASFSHPQNGGAWAQTKASCFNIPLYGKTMEQKR